jgi:aspartyl-tRNA(Asn)/glutamyl-tRNA(Gln) amidotransferase subunit A
MKAPATLISASAALGSAKISSAALVETALARARDPAGEGRRTFRGLREQAARDEAEYQDRLRATGVITSPLAGLPVSIKDNIDLAGEPTRGGSKLLEDAEPAHADAAVVARLKAAGAVIVGRTNMSELAFSGLGTNPFYGTPANPFDRATRRLPGGSSSGAAISVTDGMAMAALGTDTGGSVRIPAALTGIAGFKPTQARVSRDGVLPLSTLLDCVGPLAATVADCAIVDGILAGENSPLPAVNGTLRFCTADDYMLQGADESVLAAYAAAKEALQRAGADITSLPPGAFDEIPEYNRRGTYSNVEAWQRFGALIRERPNDIDSRIAERILRGANISSADLSKNTRERARMMARFERAMLSCDALIAPTVPVVAPKISDVESDDGFRHANALILRNPMTANLLDAPSLTIPCHASGAAPVGLMLIGPRMSDRRLLAIGIKLEQLLAPVPDVEPFEETIGCDPPQPAGDVPWAASVKRGLAPPARTETEQIAAVDLRVQHSAIGSAIISRAAPIALRAELKPLQGALVVRLYVAELVFVQQIEQRRFSYYRGHGRSGLSLHDRQQHDAARAEILVSRVEQLVGGRREIILHLLQIRTEIQHAHSPVACAMSERTVAGREEDIAVRIDGRREPRHPDARQFIIFGRFDRMEMAGELERGGVVIEHPSRNSRRNVVAM